MPGHVDILIDYYFTLQLATTVKTGQNQQHRQAQSQLKKGLLDKVNPGWVKNLAFSRNKEADPNN